MGKFFIWLLIFFVISACTCGGKTECLNKSKISVLMNLRGKECKKVLENHNLLHDSESHLNHQYNYISSGLKIELLFLNTCGSNKENLKAVFQTIMWADVHCLRPPFFLGFVGPDDFDSLNTTLQLTQALRIPHLIKIPSISPNAHHLSYSEDYAVVKGVFKLIEIFKWKSFLIKSDEEDKLQDIMYQLLEEAHKRNICVVQNQDTFPYIVYIGNLDDGFFNNLRNSSMILISRDNLEVKVKNSNSTNSILILDNIRLNEEKALIDKHDIKWWDSNSMKDLKDVTRDQFVNTAVNMYIKALNLLCKNRNNCFTNTDPDTWNNLIGKLLVTYANGREPNQHIMTFKIKDKHENIHSQGKINFEKHNIQIYWDDELLATNEFEKLNNVPINLKNFLYDSQMKNDCINKIKSNLNNVINMHESTPVIVSEMTDSEWWTMVGTVTGVGIAMFAVGFFAVYIVYTNIRGPTNAKNTGKSEFERDSSLRRMGSERQIFNSTRNVRATSGSLQRRDSRGSIRSNISDKSV